MIHCHITEDNISMRHVVVLRRTLFQRDTSENVPLAPRGVDSFHVLKIAIKDQNLF